MLNALSSLSYPGKQPRKKLQIVTVNSITNDLAIFKTQCSSFTMSSNAQYILFGTETGIYLSTNSGASFSAKSSFSPFGSDNYQSAISDTGNVILLYQPNVTNGTIYLSTDGATTFASKQLSASGLSLCSVVMSLTGQYIIASGSGMGGGVYVSQNYGSSFVTAVSNSSAQGCACSPNGRTIVVAAAGTSPWVSTDYGSTFSTFGPNTFYQGRRAFVHPDETSFAIRAVAEDAFLYTDLSIANSALTATKYNASSSYVEVPSDKDGYSGMDQNGRLYFINGEILYSFDSSTFTTKTVVPNLNGVTFADSRLCVSYDGKYILGYTGTRLRLVQQYSETNTVTISSATIALDGTVNITYSLLVSQRPVSITWTPKTSVNQPTNIPSGTTTATFLAGLTLGEYYAFAVTSKTSDGSFVTGKTITSSIQFNQGNFLPSNWEVTGSFSLLRASWTASSLASSAVGKSFRITVSRTDTSLITTKYFMYLRSGTSTTNILSTYGEVTNANNIQVIFTSTSTVLWNAVTECIITGLTYNTEYSILFEIDGSSTTLVNRQFTFRTYTYGSSDITPDVFKFLPWRRSGTTTFYKANITPSSDSPTNWTLTQYTDTSNKGFWLIRENSPLLANNTTGTMPDQITRAISTANNSDQGAMCWGIQSIATGKSTTSFIFRNSSTYVLSCLTKLRNTESTRNTIDVYLDPNSSNTTGAILFGNINQPVATFSNWLYTTITFTTSASFVSQNYYVRLIGTSTSDLSLLVSNCEIVKTI